MDFSEIFGKREYHIPSTEKKVVITQSTNRFGLRKQLAPSFEPIVLGAIAPIHERKNQGAAGPVRNPNNHGKRKVPTGRYEGLTYRGVSDGSASSQFFPVVPWTSHPEWCHRGRSIRFSRAPDGKINGVVRQGGMPIYG